MAGMAEEPKLETGLQAAALLSRSVSAKAAARSLKVQLPLSS